MTDRWARVPEGGPLDLVRPATGTAAEATAEGAAEGAVAGRSGQVGSEA